ncbi:hypothetical protein [Fulvivirga sp.]|uniref:hypothetical protein n=1 Tax=Fulvivirga sp. TaxID=1931237 RepID=UPI0032EE9992
MKTFDDFKQQMHQIENKNLPKAIEVDGLVHIVKNRVKNNKNKAMQYFWASFVLQLIVYALLSNTIIKYWYDSQILSLSILGLVLYIPFTVVIMVKFKKMAVLRLKENNDTSMESYISNHLTLLKSFFRFKRNYELILIPLSSIIGVIITFQLFVPGGVSEHLHGAGITLAITLASCYAAIKKENTKNFKIPIDNLTQLKSEFD